MERNKNDGWSDVPAQAKVFVNNYVVGFNLGSAARSVSIGRAEAARLLKDPLINAYLEEVCAGLIDRSLITREYVELLSLDLYDQLTGETAVPRVTRDGDVVVAPEFNGPAAVSLLKEMRSMAIGGSSTGSSGVTVNIDLGAFCGTPQEVEARDVSGGIEIQGEVIPSEHVGPSGPTSPIGNDA